MPVGLGGVWLDRAVRAPEHDGRVVNGQKPPGRVSRWHEKRDGERGNQDFFKDAIRDVVSIDDFFSRRNARLGTTS